MAPAEMARCTHQFPFTRPIKRTPWPTTVPARPWFIVGAIRLAMHLLGPTPVEAPA